LEGGASALKLTTAGYHRPNGKNIHRFPDAKDSDDWGIIPNRGFEVKLSAKDMTQLIAQWRQKDIVRKNGDAPPEPAEGADFVDPQLQKALEYIRTQLDAEKPAQEPAAKATPKHEAKPEAKPDVKAEEKKEPEKKDAGKKEPKPQEE